MKQWQRLKPYQKFTQMIERRWDGIAAYCKPQNKVALGFVEELNNKIRVLQRPERDGMVQPGVEYDALCKQLTEDLLTLTNPATGNPLVSKVRRTKDIYDGPRIHDLPDLLIDWNQDVPIEAPYAEKPASKRALGGSDLRA